MYVYVCIYVYIYNWINLLCSRNWHIINQFYFNWGGKKEFWGQETAWRYPQTDKIYAGCPAAWAAVQGPSFAGIVSLFQTFLPTTPDSDPLSQSPPLHMGQARSSSQLGGPAQGSHCLGSIYLMFGDTSPSFPLFHHQCWLWLMSIFVRTTSTPVGSTSKHKFPRVKFFGQRACRFLQL